MTDNHFTAIDAAHIARQQTFSRRTFGPGARTAGVLDHIRKELVEIEADPYDLGEWVDVIILALDGAWRAGHEPQEIIDAIVAKQTRNEARTWPDWHTADPDQAIEHDRNVEVRCAMTGDQILAPDQQCGRCGWPGKSHSPSGLCPSEPRQLCGSCDVGLPMSCTCVDPPAYGQTTPTPTPREYLDESSARWKAT